MCAIVLPNRLWCQTAPWQTNGNSIWYVPAGIDAGIGTNAPGYRLHLVRSSTAGDVTTARQLAIGLDNNSVYNLTGGYYFTGSAFAGVFQARDNGNGTHLLLNPSGGNVGVGTTGPGQSLDVTTSSNDDGIVLNNSSSNGGRLRLNSSGAGGRNYHMVSTASGSGYQGGKFLITDNTASDAARLAIDSLGNVGIGTTAPQYKLSVNGTIQAKEVFVNTGWADYVFKPNYRLRPLAEVGAYIKQHHHLPEIPSEAEVQEKGVSLGEMQAKLLAKIEEITLHMIEADEKNTRLEQHNRELQERVARLEARGANGQPAADRASGQKGER